MGQKYRFNLQKYLLCESEVTDSTYNLKINLIKN